jgi:hypothetical protein
MSLPVSPLGGSLLIRGDGPANIHLQKTETREVKPKPSYRKGHLSKRTAFVREIVKEVSGYVFFIFIFIADYPVQWRGLNINANGCSIVLHHTNVVSLNFSETARINVLVSSQRRDLAHSVVPSPRLMSSRV